MTTIKKQFSLLEIKSISETIKYLLSLEMKAGLRYKIDQWAKPFLSPYQDILSNYDILVLRFCNEGETTVPQDRVVACLKDITEFYSEKDTIEFSQFKVEWIEELVTTDITILHQFMDDSMFSPEK